MKPLAPPQQAGAPFTGLPGEEASSSDEEWTITAQPDNITQARPGHTSKADSVVPGQKASPGYGQADDKQQPKAGGAADSGARSASWNRLCSHEVQSSCSEALPAAARAAAGHSTGGSTGRQNAGDAGVQTLFHKFEPCLSGCRSTLHHLSR